MIDTMELKVGELRLAAKKDGDTMVWKIIGINIKYRLVYCSCKMKHNYPVAIDEADIQDFRDTIAISEEDFILLRM